MKKTINIFLLVEAAICILLCIIGGSSSNILYDVLSFPYMQIGDVLRWLSLSGTVGNVVAWCLYVVICLIPSAIFVIKLIKRSFKAEDILLPVLSGVLFIIMYYMINTLEFIGKMVIPMEEDITIAVLGAVVYSVIIGYIILVAVRKLGNARGERLKSCLNILLFIVNAFLVYASFGTGLNELLVELSNLVEMNTGFEHELLTTKIFMSLEYVMEAIINLMVISIIIMVQSFVDKLDINNLSDEAVRSAGKISKLCVVAIAVRIVMYIIFNLSQIILVNKLYVVTGMLNIPIVLIISMMLFMLVAQFVLDTKKLKDENDMFI